MENSRLPEKRFFPSALPIRFRQGELKTIVASFLRMAVRMNPATHQEPSHLGLRRAALPYQLLVSGWSFSPAGMARPGAREAIEVAQRLNDVGAGNSFPGGRALRPHSMS
jgi:hypothetical protein